jgi:hypothetical protein
MVADLSEGLSFGKQPDCAGVTKRVAAPMRCYDAERDKSSIATSNMLVAFDP